MDTYNKPVEMGDEIEVTIESTGAKGDGIAKVNNFVVIVPGAKEGDKVKVKITRVLKKMAFAEIVTGESSSSTSSESNEDGEESYDQAEEQSDDEEN
ncbi:TRAM domain-containing protein [Candidatus Woesearchaeota archaeon]|nr:TRAM domain-containing protein [Candidatus Woesearchaeota archaeon]